MFKNYLKIALRNLLKQKLYSGINILGLAIGLACCLLILAFVQHEWSYDAFHKNKERIFRAITVQKLADGSFKKTALHPLPTREALLHEYPEVEHAVRILNTGRVIVRAGENIFSETVLYADPDFFEMFTFPLLTGSPETALSSPHGIVLTERAAYKYFGAQDPIGQKLTLTITARTYEHVVTAVARDVPGNSSIQFDFIAPIERYPGYHPHLANNWNSSQARLYLELAQSVVAAEFEAKLSPFVQKYLGARIASNQNDGYLSQDADAWQVHLQPLTQVHHDPEIRFGLKSASNPVYSYILLAIAFLVLFIACSNFMTLAVGRSAGRAREVGMRKVLGGTRGQLMAQFWGEALLIAFFALLMGIALAELFLPTFNDLVGKTLQIEYTQNWFAASGLLLLLIVVGLLAGSYPALVLSSFKPVTVLKSTPLATISVKNQIKTGLLRKGLVTAQFTLSILFIICTLLMLKQLDYIKNKDLGFNQNLVVAFYSYSRDLESIQLLERFRNELQDYPQIVDVSGGSVSFGRGWSIQRWQSEGKLREVWEFRVDYDYAKTLGLQLREGRFFSGDLSTDVQQSVVVNETLVKELGWAYPVVGKKLTGWGTEVIRQESDPIIVGVVEDFNFSSLRQPIPAMVLHMTPDWPLAYFFVRIQPHDVAGALAVLKDVWSKVNPDAPFQYSFIDEDIAAQYDVEQRWGRILRYTSVFAIFIASLGLFGLASLAVARRTKEIGIRKVLGATVANVTALLSKDFVKLVLVANLIAWPVAWWAMNKWLQNFAYRVDISWWIFVLAGALAWLIALATVSAQAIRAALANPVESLRYE